MILSFNIEYRTNWGEEVKLAGLSTESTPMYTTDGIYWTAEVKLEVPQEGLTIHYSYQIEQNGIVIRKEWNNFPRCLFLSGTPRKKYRINDCWKNIPEQLYLYSSAFTEALLSHPEREDIPQGYKKGLIIKAYAPRINKDYCLAICGNQKALGNWDPEKAILMSDSNFPEWQVELDASKLKYPLEYKFILCHKQERKIDCWEKNPNRYLADPELFDESKFGKWKFGHEEAIREVLEDLLDPSLKLAVMADVGRANVVRDLPDKQDSILDMVRIATYINTIPAAIEMIETCAKKGYQTTVNIMAVSKAQESELAEALDMLGKSSVNVIYLVDSYGSLYPLQMRQLAQRYLEAAETYGKQIGIHAHNNQQLAFANTTECAMMGVSYLDATMGGMGRGAGNCAMELLLGFLKNPKYDIKPVLRFLEKHIQKLKHDGVVWGYDIQYLLTGYLNQHPRI